ncbi:MAG: CDP-alcohol phosphatidyltransferase family protein [Rikenellaceae bacterium]|nr:CDP-alcohol phosphatidyltransferase family protein [Rikenellaceae bacterium]
MSAIVKHIPNTITSMNLLCGVLGILCSFEGQFPLAFCFMLGAAVCDFCDGLSARLLKAYSPIGKELDSLADLVSFGVLPALMMCLFIKTDIVADSLGWSSRIAVYAPLLIAVFSALRLAKFNVDDRQTDNFIGMATPTCAMLVGSMVCYASLYDASAPWLRPSFVVVASPLISVALSLLLVSEIPMFGMKIKKGARLFSGLQGKLRMIFLLAGAAVVVLVVCLHLHFSAIFFMVFSFYVVLNILAYPWTVKK